VPRESIVFSVPATALLAGNNDERVRVVDVNYFDRIVAYHMPWAVNVRYYPGLHNEERLTNACGSWFLWCCL